MMSAPDSSDPEISPTGFRLWTRRRFLGLIGRGLAGGIVAALVPQSLVRAASRRSKLRRWSDPDTWGRRVPGRRDIAVIRGKVLLDRNARVAGVMIGPGSSLIFDSRKSLTLRTSGNVVAHGRLVMRPANPRVEHRLLFTGVKENRFVGGGMNALRSDVGLWVMDHGRLDLRGSSKLAWTRTTEGVAAGASSIELQSDPVGWRVGDEIVLTPTESPAVSGHHARYDQATIVAISGRTIQLSGATAFPHPTVDIGRGIRLSAEVLNLSRNVRIEGTPGGRTHVFIHSMHRQMVRDAVIRFAGPRQPSPDGFTQDMVGRYGLHFHHCGNGSRRSEVTRVVVRDCGSHAFVPHESHGITFTDCISHDTFEDAYWYDPRPDRESPAPATNDALYDHCVASLVRFDPPSRGFRLSGFFLGAGSGSAALGCVAVGVEGEKNASGFIWPEESHGMWGFEDCLAHNNAADGIFTWQNNNAASVISRFVAYHNGRNGIEHGAYLNRFTYQDSVLYGNAESAVALHALSGPAAALQLTGLLCDGAGLSDYAVFMTKHALAGSAVQIAGCTFRGHKKAAFACTFNSNQHADRANLIDCTYVGNQFWLESLIHPDSVIQIRDRVLGSLILRRRDQPGILRPEWNASVQILP